MKSDPFAYCRQQGIVVVRQRAARRWFTAQVFGAVFVSINASLTPAQQRQALAEALMAHPSLAPKASRR